MLIKGLDRKTTERVYAAGKDTEGVEDGPDSADMEEGKGCAYNPGKYSGITLLSPVLKLLEMVLDAMIRRGVEGDIGENSKGSGRGEERQTGYTS